MAVRLTQKEGDLIQEKFEVNKLVSILKQVCNLPSVPLTLKLSKYVFLGFTFIHFDYGSVGMKKKLKL